MSRCSILKGDPPQLYSEFAEPLELLEIILLIFHISGHRDSFLVNSTWEALLARSESLALTVELGADGCTAREEPPERRLEAISNKVIDLGRRFHSNDVAFPLGQSPSRTLRSSD